MNGGREMKSGHCVTLSRPSVSLGMQAKVFIEEKVVPYQ